MPKRPDLPLAWTVKHQRVLELVFEGRWTQDEITEKLCAEYSTRSSKFRLTARTVRAWIAHPDFQERLAATRADFAASVADVTYADKARRVVGLNQMAEAARREFEAHPLLREVRPTRDGEITNESFNQAAFAEYRAALEDIAKELGQRTSKVDVTSAGLALERSGAGGGVTNHVLFQVILDDPHAAQLATELAGFLDPRAVGTIDADAPGRAGKPRALARRATPAHTERASAGGRRRARATPDGVHAAPPRQK